MPWPSTGEKLPLVTTPTGGAVEQHGLLGARRPAALGGDAPQAAADARAPARLRAPPARGTCGFVQRDDPAEAGLQRA